MLWPLSAPLGPDGPAGFGFAAALAVRDACAAAGADEARLTLKWPNDVLLDGGKISGLLIELFDQRALGIGIGVNLTAGPGEGVSYKTSALRDACEAPSPSAFLALLDAAFLARIASWRADGFAVLRDAWLAAAHGLGAPVKARLPNGEVFGVFEGLTATGALCLATPDGPREVTAGDVFFPGGTV